MGRLLNEPMSPELADISFYFAMTMMGFLDL
jgi:hypothetical protein